MTWQWDSSRTDEVGVSGHWHALAGRVQRAWRAWGCRAAGCAQARNGGGVCQRGSERGRRAAASWTLATVAWH